MEVPQKTRNRIIIRYSNCTAGYISEENENINFKRYKHPNVHRSIIYNSQGSNLTAINRKLDKDVAYICMYVCMCVCIYICIHTYMHTHIYATSVYMHVCICACMYMCMQWNIYSAIKKNEILRFATTQRDTENILLIEIGSKDKDK